VQPLYGLSKDRLDQVFDLVLPCCVQGAGTRGVLTTGSSNILEFVLPFLACFHLGVCNLCKKVPINQNKIANLILATKQELRHKKKFGGMSQ
jgi:hypothetical protein